MTHICRICLDEINENELTKPCICTQGFFHKECLKKWIMEKKSEKCEVCLTKYKNITIKDKFDYKNNLVFIGLTTYTFITTIFIWIFFFIYIQYDYYLKYILPPIYTCGSFFIFVFFIKCKLVKYKKVIYFEP